MRSVVSSAKSTLTIILVYILVSPGLSHSLGSEWNRIGGANAVCRASLLSALRKRLSRLPLSVCPGPILDETTVYSYIHSILWRRLDIADLIGLVDESCGRTGGYKT